MKLFQFIKYRFCRFRSGNRLTLFICVLLLKNMSAHAQDNSSYFLGNGLLVFGNTFFYDYTGKPIPLYQDTLRTILLTNLTLDQTTCPKCMECMEPVAYYKGIIHPFICGEANGMNFICTRTTPNYNEIIIDTSGTRAYTSKDQGAFYSWNDYMQMSAELGDYFGFNRQWDSTVLYDKPYDLAKLPEHDKNLQVGLNIKNVENLFFYPESVDGYWMKLKAVRLKKTVGCCWIIWRNEKEWLVGFQFRTD